MHGSRQVFAVLAVLFTAVVGSSGLAHAAGPPVVLDQSQPQFGTAVGEGVYNIVGVGLRDLGQSFTAGRTGRLDHVVLPLTEFGTVGNLTVSLYDASGGLPVGEPLVQATVAPADGPTGWPPAWVSVSLPPVAVRAGKQYAIELSSAGTWFSNGWIIGLPDSVNNVFPDLYAGGTSYERVFKADGTVSLIDQGFDLPFQTYVIGVAAHG